MHPRGRPASPTSRQARRHRSTDRTPIPLARCRLLVERSGHGPGHSTAAPSRPLSRHRRTGHPAHNARRRVNISRATKAGASRKPRAPRAARRTGGRVDSGGRPWWHPGSAGGVRPLRCRRGSPVPPGALTFSVPLPCSSRPIGGGGSEPHVVCGPLRGSAARWHWWSNGRAPPPAGSFGDRVMRRCARGADMSTFALLWTDPVDGIFRVVISRPGFEPLDGECRPPPVGPTWRQSGPT